jgi:hypothetical protein
VSETADSRYEALDALTSAELHDRAVELAQERHDLGFFWRLLKAIPEAESASGRPQEATADLLHVSRWIADFIDSRDLDDALRPFFLEYLLEHGT